MANVHHDRNLTYAALVFLLEQCSRVELDGVDDDARAESLQSGRSLAVDRENRRRFCLRRTCQDKEHTNSNVALWPDCIQSHLNLKRIFDSCVSQSRESSGCITSNDLFSLYPSTLFSSISNLCFSKNLKIDRNRKTMMSVCAC